MAIAFIVGVAVVGCYGLVNLLIAVLLNVFAHDNDDDEGEDDNDELGEEDERTKGTDRALRAATEDAAALLSPGFVSSDATPPLEVLPPAKGNAPSAEAQVGKEHLMRMADDLVAYIAQHGHGSPPSLTFGELFGPYSEVCDNLIGLLRIARRDGRIAFDGPGMLFQGASDHVVISLCASLPAPAVSGDAASSDDATNPLGTKLLHPDDGPGGVKDVTCGLTTAHLLRVRCVAVVEHVAFESFVIVAIVLSSICLALDSPRLDQASALAHTLARLNILWAWLFFAGQQPAPSHILMRLLRPRILSRSLPVALARRGSVQDRG